MITMSNVPKINAMQLSFFIISSRVSVMTIFLPVIGTHTSTRDAWMSAILSGLLGCLITWMIVKLSEMHPTQTLVQICVTLLGKWAGGIFGLIFVWFFLHTSIITVRQFAEILNNAIMPETPVPFFIIYVEVAVAFCVYRGLEAMMRSNMITLPISLVSILFIFIFIGNDFRAEELLPMLEEGLRPVVIGSIVPTAWFGEIILIPMLYPYIKDKEKVLKYSLFGVAISTLILVMLSIVLVGVFGPDEALDLSLPVFILVHLVNIAYFFERIEAIIVAVWICLLFTKMCIYLYAGVKGMGQWLHLRSYKFLIIPMTVFSLIQTNISFESISDLKHFLTPSHWGAYALTVNTVLPMLLFAVTIYRKRKRLT